ncbi:acetyl-CoA C-acyltransferase [Aeromicrobium yanjiei]|uniref:Acetyl-CoA C-acyltransferase n=1 Tax=Aeromicrobium yanjiei TaxID=2662028 RepID=A0A5Q2MKN9_9ACTN|nr:thiolase family protein [Aeromicrobium sp. S22]MRK01633.1 acetyl-CoA C-acyltransferase [Aeromicrobium sp. S22]QGG41602.1 acetyl-CoA C-acyltransferase [Aeromicrobium yanjiei]
MILLITLLVVSYEEASVSTRDAVIVDAVRTPVGRRNGSLASVHAAELSAHILRSLTERNALDPALVDDVVWGCVQQVGQQSQNIGRNAVLAAGWPESVPATTIDRQCGSSQQSVHFVAAGLVSGQYDIAVAGGVENMSSVPMGSSLGDGSLGSPSSPAVQERYGVSFNQGVGAEMMAEKWALSREALDEYSARSHERLAAAIDGGRFESQIAPVTLADGTVFSVDEGLRRGTSVETLSKLKPVFKEDGVIHAGNASQISDGAAGLLMMTSEKAAELGLTPIARIHTAVLAGDDPIMMLSAPIPVTHKALKKSGLTIDQIGAFEVNEAFAPVPMAWLAETGADIERLNPNGGAIAIGHPLGGSGARIMTTLVHHMRDNGIQYGYQTMCEGGGMANGTIIELLS